MLFSDALYIVFLHLPLMKQISKQPIPSQFANKSHTFLFSTGKWCQQNLERQKYYPKNYIERYRHNHKHKFKHPFKHYFTPLFPFSHSTTFSTLHQCFFPSPISPISDTPVVSFHTLLRTPLQTCPGFHTRRHLRSQLL